MLKTVKGTLNWGVGRKKKQLGSRLRLSIWESLLSAGQKRKDDHAHFDRNEYKWESRDGCDDRAFAGGDLYSFKDASALVSY